MESSARRPEIAAAFDATDAGLDVLLAEDWAPGDVDEAAARVRELEVLGRRVRAAQLRAQEAIGRSGVHRVDGHASPKVMVRHCARLSGDEALRRDKAVRALRDLPVVAAGLAAGRIGVSQVDLIARVFANGRVRDQLIEHDQQVARAAAVLPYPEFEAALRDWERLTDEDGAGDRAERQHANRDFQMPRNLDGSHRFAGGGGALSGQVADDIWKRQIEREFEADWADARRRCGDAATLEDLARTDAQRRYDAWLACWVRGDQTESGAEARTCTDLVIDGITFERHLARLFGTDPGPDPRRATWWDDVLAGADLESDGTSDAATEGGVAGFRCSTIDGRPLDPTEVVVATMIGHIRRVVVGADGVVLDMGRRARCFTGPRQTAVRLTDTRCLWTGCDVGASQCQCDHLEPFNGPRAGPTSPENGGPVCGRHNRLKELGFRAERDRWGRWHVYRPDGTEIT